MNRLVIVLVLLPSLLACAQEIDKDSLQSYVTCQFNGQFQIVESAQRSQPFMRSLETMVGKDAVEILHGWSLHIAYEDTPFVNFKAEQLSKTNFQRDKKTLISNLEYLITHTEGMESNKPQQSALNGFDVYALNRKQLEGGVLSIYLLFQDSAQVVVTLYLLNTPPEAPKFSTIQQYQGLRDKFLNSYTVCASKHLNTKSAEPGH